MSSIKTEKTTSSDSGSISDDLDDDSITKDDCFKLADLYFYQKNIMYSHHPNSFDQFLDETIPNLLENGNNSFFERLEEDRKINYYFKYTDIQIVPPSLGGESERMYPCDARERNLTYSVKLMATVTQMQEITYTSSDKVVVRQIDQSEKRIPLGYIPICVRSKYCSLKHGRDMSKFKKECDYDPGGYFIVNGSEKVIISLERMCDNKTFVFKKKEGKGEVFTTQINSKSYKSDELLQVATTKLNKDNTISVKLPILAPISLFVFFRALGVESDQDIISYITYDLNNRNMINLLRYSLDDCYDDNNNLIRTQQEAFDYMITKMKILKRYSETDIEERKKQKVMHLKYLLENNFLPHMKNNLQTKAYYLGYIINKLLRCKLGYISPDDRDNYINKRIDLPGKLIEDLFRQNYKKMLLECRKFFRKRMGHNRTDDNPINVISQIKPNIIEQGLKASLLTGNWSGKKKGVAQMLQRLTYLQTLSTLRRVNSPTVDPSTNKLTSPRHLHASHIGFICPAETPEGNKTGLVKNLSLIGSITIGIKSQNMIIIDILSSEIENLLDIEPLNINERVKVFLNGEWLGTTKKGNYIYNLLRDKKLSLTIEPTTGITYDVDQREIKIYTDGGRLFRPVLTVDKYNNLNLKKEHIDRISFENINSNINTNNWDQFMIRNKGVVEFMDVEEAQYKLVAMQISDLYKMKQRMNKAKQLYKKKTSNNIINRYGDGYFVKYTHCEIHPSLLLGLITSNIPFCNHNQGPRNIYQYSQARQAMGIYTSNYRYRLDISHLLYNPQTPLVNTHAMRYTNADKLPSGENVILVIGVYGGYNQEDSIIINQSALDRGLFRSTSLKKASSVIKKNQITSKDDIFIKPDRETVTGMRSGSYDKLNEQGYVEEETVVNNNDIILAKVSPIQTFGNSTKMYKDNSEFYKSGTPGIVDKVYTDILNYDGYKMRKMRIRSERKPRIGDKFCSRHGQKGTIGITFPACDMPFTKDGLQPDIIMNPNALPSRMTVGQLVEGLVSKLCAHRGFIGDGTPFNNIDIEELKNQLEKDGMDRNGEEYLYNGMTGQKLKCKIFIVPTYYQRLKHMVADKEHSRARGPRTLLTRQAPEGRSRDGGLRFGEMERDCVISHGMAKFLKERMVDTADGFTIHVCTTCGFFAKRMMKNEITPYGSKHDIYVCSSNSCKFPDIYKIRIPYAFKLLIQELKSMNIASKIRIKKD